MKVGSWSLSCCAPSVLLSYVYRFVLFPPLVLAVELLRLLTRFVRSDFENMMGEKNGF